jgi:hypothetical protein
MWSPKIVAEARERLEKSLGFPLRDYTETEVDDYAFRLKDVDWSPGTEQVLQNLPPDAQAYIINEAYLCKIDFRYWASRYCYLLGDDKRLIKFSKFWPGQEKLLKAIGDEEERQWEKGYPPKIRMCLLKSRQVGGTAISEALAAHMTFLQPHTQSVVGSDHPDNTLKLWQTILRMYDNMPGWQRPKSDARPKATNLHFPDLDSDIVYGSGNQKTTLGQGMTIDFAHLTEVSTWEYPQYLDEDLFPAFDSSRKHHTMCILESTGQGARGNWFHDQFMAAWQGKSLFRSLFVAWYLRPSWRTDPDGVTLDKETLGLARRVQEEQGVVLDKGQLAWWQLRRLDYTAKNKLEVFYQEIPSVVEEAFQTGYRSVFSIELRSRLSREVKKPVDVYEFVVETKKLRKIDLDQFWQSEDPTKWDNKLVVWERKKPGYVYVVAVDASHGIDGGDNAAIEVLRVGNRVRPDEQVAEYCGAINPVDLAEVAWVTGHVFCEAGTGYPAKVAVEVNPGSPGIVTQNELLRRNYPHFFRWRRPLRTDGKVSMEVGWWTTPATRPLLTERGVNAIKKDQIWLNSPELIREMGNFVNTGLAPNGEASREIMKRGRRVLEAAPGEHDDRIMALFIAIEVAHADDMVNIAEERRIISEQAKLPSEETIQFNTMTEPWEELVAKWEQDVVDRW